MNIITSATQGHHRTSHITMLTRYRNIWTNRNTSGTSGTSHQDNTGHHLPTWHNPRQSFQSMALPLLPDTLSDIHFWSKNLLCSITLCMWAPTHKMPKFPQLTLTPVILPDYLRMAQILTAHNTSVQYDVL